MSQTNDIQIRRTRGVTPESKDIILIHFGQLWKFSFKQEQWSKDTFTVSSHMFDFVPSSGVVEELSTDVWLDKLARSVSIKNERLVMEILSGIINIKGQEFLDYAEQAIQYALHECRQAPFPTELELDIFDDYEENWKALKLLVRCKAKPEEVLEFWNRLSEQVRQQLPQIFKTDIIISCLVK